MNVLKDKIEQMEKIYFDLFKIACSIMNIHAPASVADKIPQTQASN